MPRINAAAFGEVGMAIPDPVGRLETIRFFDADLDSNSLRLSSRGGAIGLSVTEYKLLIAILQSPGWQLPKKTAAFVVWDHASSYEASDTYRKCGERLNRLLSEVGSSLVVVLRNESFSVLPRSQ